MPLARINRNELYGGLPWDPALGSPPSDTTIVGTRAVYTAIGTNSLMVVSKLAAFGVTGSASILSEAVHSIADLVSIGRHAPVHSIISHRCCTIAVPQQTHSVPRGSKHMPQPAQILVVRTKDFVQTTLPDEKLQGNQCLLIVGISQSLKEADAAHPYGYATERYVWSLISGSSPLNLPQHAPRPTSNPWLVAFVRLRPKNIAPTKSRGQSLDFYLSSAPRILNS